MCLFLLFNPNLTKTIENQHDIAVFGVYLRCFVKIIQYYMTITAKEIAGMLGGDIVGNGEVSIQAPAKIEEGLPGTLTFLSNNKYEKYLYTTEASAVLVHRDFKPSGPTKATLILVDNVNESLGTLLKFYDELKNQETTTPNQVDHAFIDDTAKLGTDIQIGIGSIVEAKSTIGNGTKIFPQVYIGSQVTIGKNCMFYPGVKIMHGTIIGDNCVVHSNTVVGSDGFGFSRTKQGYTKIPQIGNVIIENDVEIGSSCVIDRAVMGSTFIRRGAKLDNLIQIAHNVDVGAHTVIAAQAGIAGSAKIGAHNLIGGQVGIAGHLKLADHTRIQAKSGVSSDIKQEGSKLYGYPALDYYHYLRAYNVFKNLPELEKQVEYLQRQLDLSRIDEKKVKKS